MESFLYFLSASMTGVVVVFLLQIGWSLLNRNYVVIYPSGRHSIRMDKDSALYFAGMYEGEVVHYKVAELRKRIS